MNATRLWQIGAAAVIIAILALGYFVGISPKLTEASDAAAQLQQANGQNDAEQATVDKLKGEYNNMSALEAKLTALQLAIPSSPDGGDFFHEVNVAVQQSGVEFTSISFGEPTPFANSTNTNTSAIPPASSTPAPTATSTAAPATTTTGSTAANAPIPAAGVAYTVDITLNVTGTTAQVMDFDSLMQNGTRLFLATSLGFGNSSSTTKSTTTGSGTAGAATTSTTTVGSTGTFTGFIFVVSGPSATSTPAPTPTSTSIPTPNPTGTSIPTLSPTPTNTPKP